MSELTGLLVLAVVLAAATAFGLVRAARDGRMRRAKPGAALRLTGADLGEPLGGQATLVQFSTDFCANCPGTRRLLGEVAADRPGVRLVEIDAEERLDLVRRADVMRTPTVLVLDRHGRVARRSAGAPSRSEVLAALELVSAS
ncbi:TlpA family protein disulfide reductase [Streptacidiphilus sp. MAP5-3]|uniref:TlpA family protein disulfide reductase n=1 Tax=unclassified Streptacidiphilus TaxID=2643834 RepID=UPI0035135982